MAASSKFDHSASPDRSFGSTVQCAPFSSTSFDRSGSFRDSMENSLLSSHPSMPRSSSAVTHEDVINFLKSLRFDQKSIAAAIKLSRQGEINRIASMADEISQDDSLSASSKGKLLSLPSEELRKAKAELRESLPRTRERVTFYGEAISVLNKCFPVLPSRKRSRTNLMSGDRANAVPSSNRSVIGPSMGKMGTLTPAFGNALEVDQQKLEERAKVSVISKRIRTSLLDSRASAVPRLSMPVDKDRDVPRIAGGGVVSGEDFSLGVGIDGWEKSKMKKKRSGFKPDVSPSKLVNKPVDSYGDGKQGVQQRHVTNFQTRLNDSRGFRPGVSNEVAGVGETGGILQHNGLAVHSAFSRGDQENNSVAWDKKNRATASEKERVNVKTMNKSSARTDYTSASPTSDTKVPASARAACSNAVNLPKLSPTAYQQSISSSEWENSQSIDRPSASMGPNDRKRAPSSVRSSSPQVAHWAGQRPQKISRLARRTDLHPIVSNNDESPVLDDISDAGNDDGSATRCFHGSCPQQVKSKGDCISSAALSESEESGVAETKFKDKMLFNEVDGKAGRRVQKGSPNVLPPRKNKLINREYLGDGVCRQARSGRGLTYSRSLKPATFEKLGNTGTEKQLRTPKICYDRAESKVGRPPTRKISDRRAYTRVKNSVIPVAIDFPGLGDGHSELLAAAKAIFTPPQESFFWRFMGPVFGFICEADIIFLKQQEECPDFADADNSVILANGFGWVEHERDSGFLVGNERAVHFLELLTLEKGGSDTIPLFQRLIAALVTEEEGTNEGILVDEFQPEFQQDSELDNGTLGYGLMGNLHTMGSATPCGMQVTTVQRTVSEVKGYKEPETGRQLAGTKSMGDILNFSYSFDGLLPESQMMPNMVNREYQYDDLSIEERLHLEIHGIGIFPVQNSLPDQLEERLTDNDDICKDIRKLARSYHELVSKKKGFNDKLIKLASETIEHQKKVYEQCAFDKLIIMAYGKYMGWDSSYAGKSNNSKVARKASLTFVKRTLEHCRKFEATGISCFDGPLFMDIFHSGPTRLAEAQSVDVIVDGESARPYPTAQQVEPNMDVQSPSMFDKEDILLDKGNKRELLLDDVGGNVVSSSRPSGSISGSGKGKRSERDREGKGQGRDGMSRNGASRPGRPFGVIAKGERKSKAKPKQKAAHLPTSFNGSADKSLEKPRVVFPAGPRSSDNTTDKNSTEKDDFCLELDDPDLQLPGTDVDLGGQGQDLGSWLNIDEEGLDLDIMGLEIPMDDLTNINMMV